MGFEPIKKFKMQQDDQGNSIYKFAKIVWFLNERGKTTTKVITLANHNRQNSLINLMQSEHEANTSNRC